MITVLEGQTKQLEVTATFKGDHNQAANGVEIDYSLDPNAYWAKGQFNEATMITGTATTSDFTQMSGSLRFSETQTSQTIAVTASDDDENENNEKFYANLSFDLNLPTDTNLNNLSGGHQTREQVCENPVISFRTYGYFTTINIRDKSFANHWLFGNN
ncbi:MAG: hypothetical protein OXC62_02750 [Aestuariivita sp.]|nr:hypothetical protein [Aestuariivita sp.]